jgi:hypothetical protein
LRQGLARVRYDAIAKHVRMATGHLVREPSDDVGHGELALLARDLTVEHDLEEKVAQLFDEMVGRAFVDSRQHFVRFLEEVGLQGGARLLPVPRATALASQASHQQEQGIEAVRSRVGHGRCRGLRKALYTRGEAP